MFLLFSNSHSFTVTQTPLTELLFTSALPSGFTCVRAGAGVTYRDSDGVLQIASVNQARFDHDLDGNPLGLLIERDRVNKLTCYNANPTITDALMQKSDGSGYILKQDNDNLLITNNIGGWSVVSNDAGTSFSVVSAPIPLSNAGLEDVCTSGLVYCLDNTLGTNPLIVESTAVVGNTNRHSCQMWTYIPDGVTVQNGTFGVGFDVDNGTFLNKNTDWTHVKVEGVVPDNSSRKLRIKANAGQKIYFILPQLEEWGACSSIIITEGAARTRNRDTVKAPLSSAFLNPGEGGLIVYVRQRNQFQAEQHFFGITNSTAESTQAISIRNALPRAFPEVQYIANGTDSFFDDVQRIPDDRVAPIGFAWKTGEAYAIVSGGLRIDKRNPANVPVGLDTIWLGRQREFNGYFEGYIEKLITFGTYPDIYTIGHQMTEATDYAVAALGQSNQRSKSRGDSDTLRGNDGEVGMIREMDAIWTGRNNYWLDASLSGSGLIRSAPGTGYWWDDTLNVPGPLLTRAVEQMQAFSGTIKAVHWNQGETNADSISAANWELYLVNRIFAHIRSVINPDMQFFIESPGRRSDYQSAGYTKWRDLYQYLPTVYNYIHCLPETMDLAIGDTVHILTAEWAKHAPRAMRKIFSVLGDTIPAGPVEGPTISSASLLGNVVTCTVAYPAGSGNNFTGGGPTAFKFFNNTTEITVTGFTKISPTQFTLTLASTPTGVLTKTLYYGYGTLLNTLVSDLIKDTNAYGYLLQYKKATVTTVSGTSGFSSGFSTGFG